MSLARKDFLSQPAPPNYVAGVGRGALGFTTRSDLGHIRTGPSDEQIKEALAKRAHGGGGASDGAKPAGARAGADEGDDERYQDPDNEIGLFAGSEYDKDDEESDRVWAWVDERMDRRRRQREAREKAEQDEYDRNNPKISSQFADLKRALGTVTDDEWVGLPEVGDLTGKNRRARQARMQQRFYAVPDSVLAAARDSTELGTAVADDGGAAGATDGTATAATTNFAKIGEARDKVLQSRLEQASSGTQTVVGSATSIDPNSYLTSLRRERTGTDLRDQVNDVNRMRELLRSVTKTNPTNAAGWMAAARLESEFGKAAAARRIIEEACARCPRSEDVWLEAISLHEKDVAHNAKVVARRAIEANPASVRLWVAAMQLEAVARDRKRVIRQALDHIPESEALWKEAVNLEEDPADARLLLAKATELVPLSVDLWLALARLETPKNAQAVLNRARKAVPASHEVWVAAARLQEQLGEAGPAAGGTRVNIMRNAVRALVRESAMPKREDWIAEAERCEAEGAVITAGHIVRETIGYGLDEEGDGDGDRKETWMEDARGSIGRGRYETARAIYGHALGVFVNSRTLWAAAADLERNHGTRESLEKVLERAVESCPKSEDLWMMLAKERWQGSGDVAGARRILARAFRQNPNNEDIWLAAVKLEAENGAADEARKLLAIARDQAPTDRVWMKSIAFERALGAGAGGGEGGGGGAAAATTPLNLAIQALRLFPAAPKLWMLRGQVHEDLGQTAEARDAYAAGVKVAPRSVPLWLLYSRLEERAGLPVRARSVLDRARLAVPRCPELWCESVRLERRAGHTAQAKALMARAQQECPKSGLLWAERVWHLEPRTQRKPRSIDAIKAVDADPVLFVAVARIFWAERRLEKAQSWFERALVLDPDRGDTWAWYYRFLTQHGTAEKRDEVVTKCVLNEPRHGEVWPAAAKDPRNAGKKTDELLKLVAGGLLEE